MAAVFSSHQLGTVSSSAVQRWIMQELQATGAPRQIVTGEKSILNTSRKSAWEIACQIRDTLYNERDAEAREDTVKSTESKADRLAGCFNFPGYFPIVGGSTPVCSKMDERLGTQREGKRRGAARRGGEKKRQRFLPTFPNLSQPPNPRSRYTRERDITRDTRRAITCSANYIDNCSRQVWLRALSLKRKKKTCLLRGESNGSKSCAATNPESSHFFSLMRNNLGFGG